MKKITTLLLVLATTLTHAELQSLDNEALQAVEGQAGADLSLRLSLNQIYNSTTGKYEFDNGLGGVCENLAFCHLGISVNKRFVRNGNQPVSDPTQANPANKVWLVFKGIQGTIDLQKLGLDGVDLIYNDDGGAARTKPAMQLSFDPTKPILIRNFGFNALAIEQDDFTSYYDNNGKLVEGNNPTTPPASGYGYLKAPTYAADHPSVYDRNKETGFMGLKMNGNLAIQGNVMMFSCDASHPRC